jgi:P27 family predicted phage terminase small subunit
MGRRGPKPTPTPILRLHGSWRADTRPNEPQAPAGTPAAPSWVNPDHVKHWDEIAGVLASMGVMSPVHAVSLSLLVQAVGDWIEATKLADESPKTCPTATGGETLHPAQRLKGMTFQRVLQLCREFGLTPSAITGVKAQETKQTIPTRTRSAS